MQNQIINFAKNVIIIVATIAIVTLVVSTILCLVASLLSPFSFVECFKSGVNNVIVFFIAIFVTIGVFVSISTDL